jgi:hypothetical protein
MRSGCETRPPLLAVTGPTISPRTASTWIVAPVPGGLLLAFAARGRLRA